MTQKPSAQAINEENMFGEVATPDNNDIFADVDLDSTGHDDADLLTDGTDEDAEAQAKPAGDKVKIKYMGAEEEIDLSDRENLVTLLQKGRDYDKKLSELEAVKNSEEMAFIRNMAKEAGAKDTKAFIESVQKDLQNERIQRRANELMDEGMSQEHALYTADLELKAKESKPQPDVANTKEDAPDASGFVELLTEYPEAGAFKSLADFPEQVRKDIEAGKKPVEAYQKYLLAKAKAELEQAKNLEGAKQRDMGSMRSTQSDQAKDPFLTGLSK